MSAAATYDSLDDTTKNFLNSLQRLNRLSLFPSNAIGIVKVYFYVLRILMTCEKVRKQLSKIVDRCRGVCENNQCSKDFCAIAKEVRKDLSIIQQRLSAHKTFYPLIPFIQDSIEDWDDFVVDCEISSDEDIHSLIKKIANAA